MGIGLFGNAQALMCVYVGVICYVKIMYVSRVDHVCMLRQSASRDGKKRSAADSAALSAATLILVFIFNIKFIFGIFLNCTHSLSCGQVLQIALLTATNKLSWAKR